MRRKNTEDRDLFFSFPFNSHTGGPTVLVYVCTWIYIFTEVGVARVLLPPCFTRHAADKFISPKNIMILMMITMLMVIVKKPKCKFPAANWLSDALFPSLSSHGWSFIFVFQHRNNHYTQKTSATVNSFNKHRKNCECCPGHYLIVVHYSKSKSKSLSLSL